LKININLSNRWLYSILAVVIVILAGVAVYAQTVWDTSKTVYHLGSDVKVTIGGTDYDLQEAITNGLIGGGGDPNCANPTQCGTIYTTGNIELTSSGGKCIKFYSGGQICSGT